jgi:tetratricopeptide (TPR) repeat protein
MKTIASCFVAYVLLGVSGPLHAAKLNYCGELKNHYGPFDYRNHAAGGQEIVEGAHFTPEVENGIRGSTGLIGGDIDYTLRAIPNHHRALTTIGNISLRTKAVQLPGAKYPTECYFERAIRFAPDDALARAAYGNYLAALGKTAAAIDMVQAGADLEPNNATINYNLGLLYMKAKKYDKASEYADKAYALGFPLPGLRNQLAQVRKGPADAK